MQTRKLSVIEAAEQLGVSKFTVRALLRRRELASYRIGRRVVLDAADVADFLDARRIDARSTTSGAA